VENAIRDQARLSEGGAKPMLAVNISGRCLSDVEFCAFVVEAVQSSGACLSLEITETALIDDPLIAISTLSAFRAAGIKISIDDYGAGLSSLSYLKTLAADELKLDRSLLADILQNARDKIIIKSTIELAHSLGMSVVAEGVEDTETARLLADMDCDLVQGYLVSKPLPLEAFQDLQKRSAETRAIWRERRVA
jgi:EAL domain-containing protein (putative c-di-GMP-specific phosphodiesterase class I)